MTYHEAAGCSGYCLHMRLADSWSYKLCGCSYQVWKVMNVSGPATPGGPGGHATPLHTHTLFFRSKNKIGKKRKKRKSFKAKTIKRLSPRSKYYCSSHSRASRIQKIFLSANIPFQCSMAPPLWNPFRRPCVCHEIIWKKDLLLWFKFTICPVLGVILVHSIYLTCPLDYAKGKHFPW